MAVYELTSPQGEKYEVTAPDDATEDQVLQYFQQNYAQANKLNPPDGNMFQRLGQDIVNRNAKAESLQNEQRQGRRNSLQNILPQAGNAFGLLVNDVPSEALKSVYRTAKDIAPNTVNMMEGNLKSNLSYLANTGPGKAVTGAATSALQKYGEFSKEHPIISDNLEGAANILMGALPIKGTPAALRVLESPISLTKGAIEGSGKAIQGGANFITSQAANRLLSPADNVTMDLAKKAANMGIDLRLDQLTESPAMTNFQKISRELPGSGVNKFADQQSKQINKAAAKSMGLDSEILTPEVLDKQYNELGKQFNDYFKGKRFSFSNERLDKIGQVVDEATKYTGSDTQKIVQNHVNDFIKDLGPGNEITGEKLNEVRKRLGTFIRNNKDQSGEAAEQYVQKIMDEILDVVTDGDPSLKTDFTNLKYKYKNAVTLTPLVGKARRGDINPQLLENRVKQVWGDDAYSTGKAGELGDLARISKTFLTSPAGSDTIPKGMYVGLGAALLNPPTAALVAPKVGVGLGANRLYQSAISDPKVVGSFLRNSEIK